MSSLMDHAGPATVVVGGGPAGLAAAYRLSEDPTRHVVVLERAPQLGGLAAGLRRDGMRLDFGPHRLHPATDPLVLSDLQQLLGSDLQLRRRHGLIQLRGRSLPYPLSPRTLLRLGPRLLASCLLGLGTARLRRRPAASPAASPGASYEDAVVSRLGRPLYELFYGPFAEKVWGLPGCEIAVEQAARRVNQRGLRDLVALLVASRRGSEFWYPRRGFGQITDAYAQALAERPNVELRCEVAVEAIHLSRKRAAAVSFQAGGMVHQLPVDQLIWTAPITALPAVCDPRVHEVATAAGQLRHRAVVIAYAKLDVPYVGSADTYYFPERSFPFNRVTDQRRFSPDTVPDGHTVLVMDLSCDPDDARFSSSDAQIEAEVVPALHAAGLLRSAQVRAFWTQRFRHAYPVYRLGFEAPLDRLNRWAGSIENLWPVGRQGLYLHNNTHHSLLMGYRAAETIAGGADRQRWADLVASFNEFTVAD